ncbi:MAG TPA: transporter substrate-binding domain-containing protein [Methylibium sp.]
MSKSIVSRFVGCALLASCALLGAVAHAQNLPPTLSRIAADGVIHVSYRESSVPFSYLDNNNKPVGFAMDLCAGIVEAVKARLKKPDLKVDYQLVTSQNRIPLVVNGTVDIECGSTTNNTVRRENVEFAINHFYTGTRLLVKKGSGIKTYADLKGKTVATTTGTTNYQVLRKYDRDHELGLTILPGKDHADSLLLVESDRAVAFAMDDILLYGLAANSKNPAEWEVVGEALQVEPYAIMLRKNDPEFKKLVDDTLLAAIKSGEFERLYRKWLLSPIPPKGINLSVPMSEDLIRHLKAPSDRPAL